MCFPSARLALLGLLLAACGDDRPSNQPSSHPAAQPSDTPAVVPSRRRAVVYFCEPDLRLLTAHESATDRIFLQLPEGPLELDHEPAASGAKYASGSTVFWSKGNEATLEHQGKTWQCRLDVRDTRIEALRSAGARFWATGNEPGWNLVVWPDSVVLVANYGEDTLLFPLAPPDLHPDTTHAAWNIQAGGRTLMLTILRQPCADDMSGEPWTHQVEYLLDSTRLRGCGKALY